MHFIRANAVNKSRGKLYITFDGNLWGLLREFSLLFLKLRPEVNIPMLLIGIFVTPG